MRTINKLMTALMVLILPLTLAANTALAATHKYVPGFGIVPIEGAVNQMEPVNNDGLYGMTVDDFRYMCMDTGGEWNVEDGRHVCYCEGAEFTFPYGCPLVVTTQSSEDLSGLTEDEILADFNNDDYWANSPQRPPYGTGYVNPDVYYDPFNDPRQPGWYRTNTGSTLYYEDLNGSVNNGTYGDPYNPNYQPENTEYYYQNYYPGPEHDPYYGDPYYNDNSNNSYYNPYPDDNYYDHYDEDVEFWDLAGHPYENYVLELARIGIIQGYPDGTFRPEQPVTRAEMTKMVLMAAKLDTLPCDEERTRFFTDLDNWQAKWVNAAYRMDIVEGYTGGYSGVRVFQPNNWVNRAEGVKLVVASFGRRPLDFDKISFNDVHDWMVPWIEDAFRIGLIDLPPHRNFYPADPMTRGMAARVIYKMMQYSGDV